MTSTSHSRVYALVGASFDHNFAQGLNFQQIYGGGLGWTVIKTPIQEFDLKADVHYERQNFQPPTPNMDLIGSSFTELYHRNLPKKILFTESGIFIPAWNNLSNYNAIFAAGLQMPTYKRFSLSLNLIDNYLSQPAIRIQEQQSAVCYGRDLHVEIATEMRRAVSMSHRDRSFYFDSAI